MQASIRPNAGSQQQFRFLPWILLLLLGCSVSSLAQFDENTDVHVQPRQTIGEPARSSTTWLDPTLKTHSETFVKDVGLVMMPVTVTDGENHLVMNLVRNNFQVFEHDKEQLITHFSAEDTPISLGVLFDTSGSMAPKMEKARKAIVEFFKTSNPADEMFVVTFADEARLFQNFTSDIDAVQRKLVNVPAQGRTALLDAIYESVGYVKEGKYQRKALLIISDGGDNASHYPEDDVRSLVEESDIQVYAIGVIDNPKTMEEHLGPQLLSDITNSTAGRTFFLDDAASLPAIAAQIALELRNQYVLGYRPVTPPHDGMWHKVQVKLTPSAASKSLHLYTKTGYYAPAQ